MSTQLLDSRDAADTVTDEHARATDAVDHEGVSFDRATRARIVVAEAVADTLEVLADERSWDRLDPSIQKHLLAQAERLREHVAHLGSQRAVRAVEDAMLRLKRLERRLEIAVDELVPPDDAGRRAGGLFLGDFTEVETGESDGAARPAKKKTSAKTSRKSASATVKEGVHRFKTRAEREASKAVSRRITAYIVGAAVIVGATLAWNAKETFSQSRQLSKPPTAAFATNLYLKEMQVFLPATFTMVLEREIRVVISREWLLRSEQQRKTDAEGAHVWLTNRNVHTMMLTFDDGTPVARYQNGTGAWFDLANPGKAHGATAGGVSAP